MVEKATPAAGLGITDSERIEIVKAMGLSKGHWFKCPKGKFCTAIFPLIYLRPASLDFCKYISLIRKGLGMVYGIVKPV